MKPSVQRKTEKLKSTWYLWLFPLFAVLISGWLLLEFFNQRGPQVRILFDDASNIQPEKTQIRFRGVTVGTVKRVSISQDTKSVVVHVQLHRDSEAFVYEGARYWLVVPKVNLQGVSGLETLFQGNYIAALPGDVGKARQHEFQGQIGGESNDPLEDTVSYYLETDQLGSVSQGDPVTFRGLAIGSVTKTNLSKDSRRIIVQINVQNRYVRVIRENTVFWRKVAVQANLGLFNAELKVSSLETLMKGGVDLFTPNEPGPIAKAQSTFKLQADPPKNWEKWNPALEF